MRLSRLVALLAAAAFSAGLLGGAGDGRPEVTGTVYFVSICQFSHRSYDDPIVYPDKPRLSHNHTFVGNVSTNAYSTLSSLRKAGTSCDLTSDTAAYWAPTLLVHDRPVVPIGASLYYRRLTTAPVKPFPPGLRMVAGNSRAHLPQSLGVTYWDCNVVKTTFYGTRDSAGGQGAALPVGASSSVPSCPATTDLELHVNFPNCWNGKTLDSADHQSHMAYSSAGRCPSGFPVAVPALSLVYKFKPVDPRATILSSGGQHSGHADFINAWNQPALAKLVGNCLNEQRECGIAGAAAPDTN